MCPYIKGLACLSPSLINLSTVNFPWDKTDKALIFTGIHPHLTILTMLEAIRTSQDIMADEVSGNIVAELSKLGNFGGFSEERMQSLLEGLWNKAEHVLNDSQKPVGKL